MILTQNHKTRVQRSFNAVAWRFSWVVNCCEPIDTLVKISKKEDVGRTHGAKGQEDQLLGVEEKSWTPDQMAPSSTEPSLGHSTQEEEV